MKGKSTTRRLPKAHPRLENLEQRVLLAADMGFLQNPVEPLDVNDDGSVSSADMLMVVNAVNQPGGPRDGFLDPNGDRACSPADALMVLNHLNHPRVPRPPAEEPLVPGDPTDPPDRPDAPIPNDLLEGRSLDGTDNRSEHAEWGSAGIELLRLTPVDYADGVSEPAGQDRASARQISNLVATQSESLPNERGLSDLAWQWGQFLDHDIDLTENVDPTQPLPIEVPAGDPFFDPFGTGEATIDFNRSIYTKDTGDSSDSSRQQLNQISAFIDGSNVYGSDGERAAALRTFEGGRLKTSEGDLLPLNEEGLDNAGGTDSSLFLAGDVRANEQVGLTAMHTVWVREHNRIADDLSARHPELSDEEIYQRARSVVIAEMQSITFNEFLPALLGKDAIPRYEGYDPTVNPGISNVFSTAAYRFGHSMLSSELLRLDDGNQVVDAGNLSLRDAFFNPGEIRDNGIDSLLRGLATQQAQEIDTMLVDDVRNFLFGPPGSGGFDLASLNIQRGRDHGLADYNQIRAEFGLSPAEGFADITSDPGLQAALQQAYGDVHDVDAWVGMLAEDHAPGASVGETIQTVLVDQFTRLRDGDRFWYQHVFSGRQLDAIEHTTLADVIQRNTDVDGLQRNVFFVRDLQPDSERPRSDRPGGPPVQLEPTLLASADLNTLLGQPTGGAGSDANEVPPPPDVSASSDASRTPPSPRATDQTAAQRRGSGRDTSTGGPQRAGDEAFAANADRVFEELGRLIGPRQ